MSIIAISRGTFSGGEAVAKGVADRLGYRCVSREVILEAARSYQVPAEELLVAMDRRPPLWERVSGVRSIHRVLVQAVLCEYARGGKLVYHGHLGHLFLPGVSHVMPVRVIADLEFRIAAAMKLQTLTRDEAIRYIDEVDKERRQWTRFLFDVDWDDSRLYAVVLNLGYTSVAGACEAVARLSERPEFQPTVASAKAMQDLTLRSRVAAALATDIRTRSISPEVVADDGIVTVTGTTQSPAIIEAVPVVVRQVDGVKELKTKVRLLREGTPPSA
jgi:cytidylate kinase